MTIMLLFIKFSFSKLWYRLCTKSVESRTNSLTFCWHNYFYIITSKYIWTSTSVFLILASEFSNSRVHCKTISLLPNHWQDWFSRNWKKCNRRKNCHKYSLL